MHDVMIVQAAVRGKSSNLVDGTRNCSASAGLLKANGCRQSMTRSDLGVLQMLGMTQVNEQGLPALRYARSRTCKESAWTLGSAGPGRVTEGRFRGPSHRKCR